MADLEMTDVEIIDYLEIKFKNDDKNVRSFLEELLDVGFVSDNLGLVYFRNGEDLTFIGDNYGSSMIKTIFMYISKEQRQILTNRIKKEQSLKNEYDISINKNLGTTNNINITTTQNNTNSSTSLAYANSKSITDLAVAINNDVNLTNETRQEYQDLFNKIEDSQGEKSYAELISQLLNKLANDNILPIPKWLLKAIDKVLVLLKK